jgi:NitT/TauT family transport system permease protein
MTVGPGARAATQAAPTPGSASRGASAGRQLRRLWTPTVIAPLLVLVVVHLVWEAGGFHALFGLKTFSVPYPSAILAGVEEHGTVIWRAISASLPAAFIGYACGMALGFAIASGLVRYAPGAIARVLPVLSATNSLPIVALAPLVALFTGPGLILKVIVVTIMTTPVMTIYAVRGLSSIEPTALELMASVEATGGQVYRMVRVPNALPYAFTALKSSVVLALIGTIVSEAVRGFEGLGFVILDSMGKFDAPKAWLALLSIAVIGIAWYLIIEVVERLVLPWEVAHRRG